jgi:hypothetical protein
MATAATKRTTRKPKTTKRKATKTATKRKPARRTKHGGFLPTAALGGLSTALVPIALTGTALAVPLLAKSTKLFVISAKKMGNSAKSSLKRLVPGSSSGAKKKRKPAAKKK